MRTLYGGLISCGICGGSVISVNGHSYGCSNRRDCGEAVCSGGTISKKKAEAELLPAIQDILKDPEVVDYVHSEAESVLKALAEDEIKDHATIESRLNEANASIEKLIDAISQVGPSEALVARLRGAEAEKADLSKQAALSSKPMVLAKKGEIQKVFDEKVDDLNSILKENVEVARNIISGVLGDIVLKKSGLKLLPR